VTRSEKGRGRSPDRHYRTLTFEELAELPVERVAADDAFLFLWVTNPHATCEAVKVDRLIRKWGFRPSGLFATWIKLNADGEGFHFGMGYGTRQNTERVILCRRGSPRRLAADIPELLFARVREHSRKPDELRERIERFCDGPRLEMFAREKRPDWSYWGNEVRW
jgi:N6-adenosine-specific RNA methylase IME4